MKRLALLFKELNWVDIFPIFLLFIAKGIKCLEKANKGNLITELVDKASLSQLAFF